MTTWEFFEFWDYIKDIALKNCVEVSCDTATSLNMIEFRVRSRQTMKDTALCITKFDFENLGDDAKRILTEKLLDMIKEVQERTGWKCLL